MSTTRWEQICAAKGHLNAFPFDGVASFAFPKRAAVGGAPPRALDIGYGVHARFLAAPGLDVVAFDPSPTHAPMKRDLCFATLGNQRTL